MAFSPFLLFLILLHSCFIVVPASAQAQSNTLVLPLERRGVPGDTATGIPLDHLKDLHRDDQLRKEMIRARSGLHSGRALGTASEKSFRMPLSSGAYKGTAMYFVKLQLGTPPQEFLVIADTGSDLTWVNCRLENEGPAQGHAFQPISSSSFKPIPCSSDMCKTYLPNFSSATCASPASPCPYTYEYLDGSGVQGVYANESTTVTLSSGSSKELPNLVMGCTTSANGTSFKGADGVLGLGYNGVAFGGSAAEKFGGVFSYCLMDHLSPQNVSSFLSFGAAAGTAEGEMSETPLVLDTKLGPFYYVKVEGISVDGRMLPVPASVWKVEAGGGTLLDSGMSLTMLAEPAYLAVAAALNRRLAKMPRLSNLEPFEYCYNWTAGVAPPAMPRMVVHLSGGARLEPPVKSYVIDVAEGVKCLGIARGPWPGESVIGNILQQEHLWVFDVRNRRLRFGPSTCSA